MNKNIEAALDSALVAISYLKEAIAADSSVTLNLKLTKQEAEILREITRMDISIPRELKLRQPYPTLRTSEAVMAKLREALNR
jgi:hypothetical protein